MIILTYIVPAILALAVGYLLWQIKRDRRALLFEIVESEKFPVDNGVSKYFVIRLLNAGNVAMQDISFRASFASGRILSHTTSDEDIELDVSDDYAQISGCIPLINPKDSFQLTTTIAGTPDIMPPLISARTVGVTAEQRTEQIGLSYLAPNLLGPIAASVSIILAVNASVSWWTSRQQSELSRRMIASAAETKVTIDDVKNDTQASLEKLKTETEKLQQEWQAKEQEYELGKPGREQNIFAVLNRSGLGHLVPELIMTGDELPYWKTGLFLMHSFLQDEENGDKYISALSILMEQDMVPCSSGFLAYLAGKIEQERGKRDSAIAFFGRCKAQTPLTYEHLMTQDPAYDLETLKERLRTSEPKEHTAVPNKAINSD